MRPALATAAVLAALAATGCGAAAQESPEPAAAGPPPAPLPPVFAPENAATATAPAPEPAGFPTARVTRRTTLRSGPAGRVVARVGTRTEFGSPRVLAVTGRRGPWLRVIAAERPNGRPAWVRAAATEPGTVTVSLHVDRSRRRLTVRHDGRVVRRMPVAVGRPDTPTPTGRFAVTDRLRASRPDSPYGCCAIALSGHQTRLLPGWPGGDRLAVHGTPQPETVGRPVSLGCMRAHHRHIEALMRVVPLGAPVFIRA